jgi:glycosyltransferase involved in cell wall biosynthesis
VISPRGTLDRWSRARKSIRKAIAWRLWVARDLRRADLVHATSDEEDLSVRKVLPRCPTCVVPNGVRLPSLDAPHPQATDDVADSLDGRRVLLFLSRLDPKKGLDLLAAAWSAVRGRFPSWTLVIAGESLDGDDASYRRLFAGVDVVFAGHVIGAAREALFRNASLFVLPSRSENFGNSVAEALAFGVPVITTTATPWRDLPSAGCGWCVDPDAAGLAGALEDALGRDHDHLHRMGGIGRRFVASKFAWPDIAKTMVGHYEVAIERMRRGAD